MMSTETKSTTASHSLPSKAGGANGPFFDKEGGNHVPVNNGKESHFFDNISLVSNKLQPFFNRPFVQTKLTIGRPGDKYEREADAMADKAVQRLAENDSPSPVSTVDKTIQQKSTSENNITSDAKPVTHTTHQNQFQEKCAECEAEEQEQKGPEEEPLQMKPIFESDTPPPDEEAVQRHPLSDPEITTSIEPKPPTTAQFLPFNGIQAKCAACAEEESVQMVEEDSLQRMASEPEETEEVQMQEEDEEEIRAQVEEDEKVQTQLEEEKAGQFAEEKDDSLQMTESEPEETEEVQMQAEEEEDVQMQVEEEPVQMVEEEDDALQMMASEPEDTEEAQMQEEEEEVQMQEEDKEETALQTKRENVQNESDNDLESRLQSTKGSGSPMDSKTRTEMESGFGADFGGVRVHTDSNAESLSKDLGAQAFTHGNDIYFNSQKYNPGSARGKHLLAHELTHTIQQGASVHQKPDVQAQEDDVDLEKELAASEKDAKDAIDPIPAEKSREQAEKEKTEAELAAEQQVGEPEIPEETAIEESPQVLEPKKKKPDKVKPSIAEEEPKGEVGQDLDNASAGVCNQAAAKAQELADNEQTHHEAGDKLEQVEGAVEPPEKEGEATSNASQVEAVEESEDPETDGGAMNTTLSQSVEEAAPSSIKEMNNFKSEGKAKVIGNKVLAESSKQVGEVKGTYSEIENSPPPPAPDPTTPLPEQELAPETPELNLGEDAVPGLQEEHTDFSEFDRQSDELLEKEGISEEQLEMVDSGDLAEAKEGRKELKEKVETQPDEIEAFAEEKQKKVAEDMVKEEAEAKSDMKEKRDEDLGETQEKQEEAKSEMELKREEVTQKINDIYERAKTNVTTKLELLEESSLKRFDQGQAEATTLFEQEVNSDINAWKRERYSGIFGGVRWVRDLILGIDDFPEVQSAFDRARTRFIERIDVLIQTINEENERTIQECKDELAQAKEEIREYVENLGPELRDVGEKAKNEMEEKLAEMDSFIEKKKEELQQKLCDKKEAAIQAIDKKIEEMKEAMSGALSKLGNLLLNALIKFMEWALNKVGGAGEQVMGIVNKGKEVIKRIAKDPIEFFKNVGRAVGGGIKLFVSNIQQHLIKGLLGWLTGAMGDAGLVLPDKFDLKGILSVVLQVANLTWTGIRTKLVKRVGEKVVSTAEKGVDIFKRVIAEGPIALWNIVKEKAVALKAQVLEGIRNWAIIEIVKKATFKLVTMLNPAGAILQAIKALYDVVMFFIDSWDRIVEFVKSVFNSIGEIAMGQVGKAATFIEKAMAQTIPIILNFLARFLGLSGIGKAIRNIIAKIRKPIDRLLDKIVDFLAKQVKKLFKKGKAVAKEAIAKVIKFFGVKKKFTTESGESHAVYYSEKGGKAVLMVSSSPKTILEFLSFYQQEYKIKADSTKGKQMAKIKKYIKSDIDPLITVLEQAKKAKNVDKQNKTQEKLLNKNVSLSEMLKTLLSGDKEVGTIIDSYKLEGLTGTYASMPKPSKDILTADHQPQASILQWAAGKSFFGKNSNMAKRAAGRAALGYAINLYETRHSEGRTFKNKGKVTKAAFISFVMTEIGEKKPKTNQEKRSIVVERIKRELSEDVQTMKAIARRPNKNSVWGDIHALPITEKEKNELIKTIRENITKGEDQIANQDIDSLKN
ncbi:eCIS core domain-containing protein [Negadavirga shengliensis]|uniref:DUF4157 domain-containing protein n=1 Tax=Negadavirga shengliensis TaxID=1389218 RepID=A0ABV9T5N7_9BACT